MLVVYDNETLQLTFMKLVIQCHPYVRDSMMLTRPSI